MVADAQAIDDHRLLIIERDGFQWVDSAFRRLYVLDLSAPDEEGFVSKHHAVNLLWISNPEGISDGRPEGGFGLGPVFAFPLESVETVRILDDGCSSPTTRTIRAATAVSVARRTTRR